MSLIFFAPFVNTFAPFAVKGVALNRKGRKAHAKVAKGNQRMGIFLRSGEMNL